MIEQELNLDSTQLVMRGQLTGGMVIPPDLIKSNRQL